MHRRCAAHKRPLRFIPRFRRGQIDAELLYQVSIQCLSTLPGLGARTREQSLMNVAASCEFFISAFNGVCFAKCEVSSLGSRFLRRSTKALATMSRWGLEWSVCMVAVGWDILVARLLFCVWIFNR